MTPSLDSRTRIVFTDIEAAKGIASHLKIAEPEYGEDVTEPFAKALDKDITEFFAEALDDLAKMGEYEFQSAEELERELIEYERGLQSLGLSTPEEMDAYAIVCQADLRLGIMVGEIARPGDIQIDRKTFEIYMEKSIKAGLYALLEGDGRSIEAVNEESFLSHSVSWLTQEVYRRIDSDEECIFITRTSIKKRR